MVRPTAGHGSTTPGWTVTVSFLAPGPTGPFPGRNVVHAAGTAP
ncbi:hypothetical protein ABK046_14260 [Streptomyces caeruleatus]